MESYGIKVVDDVSKLLIEGELSDEDQKHQNYLDWSIGMVYCFYALGLNKQEFNLCKVFKN